MRSGEEHSGTRIVEYDALSHRLWILGQRCHHGATGSIVAALAGLGLIIRPSSAPTRSLGSSMLALALAGGALMAHDWKDHSVWFERGRGLQG
jgi:hypothetical protein